MVNEPLLSIMVISTNEDIFDVIIGDMNPVNQDIKIIKLEKIVFY